MLEDELARVQRMRAQIGARLAALERGDFEEARAAQEAVSPFYDEADGEDVVSDYGWGLPLADGPDLQVRAVLPVAKAIRHDEVANLTPSSRWMQYSTEISRARKKTSLRGTPCPCPPTRDANTYRQARTVRQSRHPLLRGEKRRSERGLALICGARGD